MGSEMCIRDSFSDGSKTLALAATIRGRHTIATSMLTNSFTAAADRVYPEFGSFRRELANRIGAPLHLSGAGPTLFAVFDRAEPARQAAHRARHRGLVIHVASSTVGLPAIRASRGTLAR